MNETDNWTRERSTRLDWWSEGRYLKYMEGILGCVG